MPDRFCPICHGVFHRERHKRSARIRTCRHELATPGPDCWFVKGGLQKLIAESLLQRKPPTQAAVALRDRLLRDLSEISVAGEALTREHLARLSSHERWSLLRFAASDLRDWLLSVYRDDKLSAVPDLEPVHYPDLPTLLLQRLQQWEEKNRRRLTARINNGYLRAPSTLRRMMAEPIALAVFLANRGVDRWETMTMSDRIAFAKTRPKSVQQKLKAFITFIEGGNPFKTRRGRPPKKANKVIRETRKTPILPPDELKARLRDARQRLTDEQYLLYWLVAKLGLTAKAAYGLTLDRITINGHGRVVIRPAEAWFALPKSLAPTMEALARAADSSWPYDDPRDAAAIPVMVAVIPHRRVGPDIFRSETTLLRSSAIHAAMHYGQLDRKTLSAITGVSLSTISAMEFLVPADIHSLVSHSLVAKRNRAILGSDGE